LKEQEDALKILGVKWQHLTKHVNSLA